jgi:hypothetical protein
MGPSTMKIRAVGSYVLFMYHFDWIVPDPADMNIQQISYF